MIVQSDFSILLNTSDELYTEKRDFLSIIAHLEKSPEYIHTYIITNISLWTAAASGIDLSFIIEKLKSYSQFEVPENIIFYLKDYYSRYGRISIEDYDEKHLLLVVSDEDKLILKRDKALVHYFQEDVERGFLIPIYSRGDIKLKLIYKEPYYPIHDKAGLKKGNELADFQFKDHWDFRPYQKQAVDSLNSTGFGVVVLPCGAGKTVIGIGALKKHLTHTLIVVPHNAALNQWRKEILSKTDIDAELIGEYSGSNKIIKPITIATYQILSYYSKVDGFKHLKIFAENKWGFIIYDEVHMLPAPVFKVTTEIQSVKRLGLTATLVREDGKERDVFALIGPKRFDIPWKELEAKKYIAKGVCIDCRIRLSDKGYMEYLSATNRERPRIAAENPLKDDIVYELVQKHKNDKIIVIGQYLTQLKRLSQLLNSPVITGAMSNKKRNLLYEDFRNNKEKILILSKVANLALDLPDASVAIQVSGAFGSRQEEAQRLGRILRPKEKTAYFYSIVSQDTVDEEFAHKRQLFLAQQGYKYQIEDFN